MVRYSVFSSVTVGGRPLLQVFLRVCLQPQRAAVCTEESELEGDVPVSLRPGSGAHTSSSGDAVSANHHSFKEL